MKRSDVVVTGIGMVTPLGPDRPTTVSAWEQGSSARREPLGDLNGTALESAAVAVLPEFDPAERLDGRRMLKYMSNAALLGCMAAREAAADANLKTRFSPERIGLYAGAGLAASNVKDFSPMISRSLDEEGDFSCRLFGEQGMAAANPLVSFKILANIPPCLVSIIEEIKGPNLIFAPWEGQTGAAILEGWRAVRSGDVACAVVGAADEPSNPATFLYLRQANLIAEDEYPSAAAAYVVMEQVDSATRDGKRPYARIRSVRLSASEKDPLDPLTRRLGRCYAAAPAVSLALACATGGGTVVMRGVDRQEFTAVVGTVL